MSFSCWIAPVKPDPARGAAECPQSEHEQFSHAHFSQVYAVVLDAIQHFDTAAAKASACCRCVALLHPCFIDRLQVNL